MAAVLGGAFFQPQIAHVGKELLPASNAGREVLYRTSPMDPSVRSDKPGKDSMGMDLVPAYANQPRQEPVVIDATLVERDMATAMVQRGLRVRTIETVGTIAYAEPRITDMTLKVDQDNLEFARQRLRYWDVTDKQIDAIPDLSDVQVIVFTEYPGQAPRVVEDQVTYPLATTMLAVPYSKVVRGTSMFGYSFVYIIFEDGTDIYWARSRVLEYLSFVANKLPAGVTPRLGPDATGVGWVYEYSLRTGWYCPDHAAGLFHDPDEPDREPGTQLGGVLVNCVRELLVRASLIRPQRVYGLDRETIQSLIYSNFPWLDK